MFARQYHQMSGEECLVKGSTEANACELLTVSQRVLQLASPAGTRRVRPLRGGPHAGPWKGVIKGDGAPGGGQRAQRRQLHQRQI